MIYFIRCQDAVKIGFTKGVAGSRASTLRTGNPKELVVLGVLDGSLEDESDLHNRFKKHHIRGEWFVLCEEIIRYVEGNCRPYLRDAKRIGADPGAPELVISIALDKTTQFSVLTFVASGTVFQACQAAFIAASPEYLQAAFVVSNLSELTLLFGGAIGAGRITWLLGKEWLAERRYQRSVRAYR